MTSAEINEIQQRTEKVTNFEYTPNGIMCDFDTLYFLGHAKTYVSDLLAHISELSTENKKLIETGERLTIENKQLIEKLERLENTNRRLRVALQDAIRQPMGVIPDSAVPFTL